jgi:hypothetical protein
MGADLEFTTRSWDSPEDVFIEDFGSDCVVHPDLGLSQRLFFASAFTTVLIRNGA